MKNQKVVWAGRALSVMVCLPFVFSAVGKIFYASMFPQMAEQMARIGLPMSILPTLTVLEILCVVVYLIPATSVLGAVLFTGYIGGTIITHLRVGENVAMQVTLGLVVWLGLYLREPRLHELLPIRKNC